jgi:phosphohistidine phosphatase
MTTRTLLLLRHAKSSWKEPGLVDHDRPLKKRGRRDAPRIGRLLREEGLVPELIISSTARRARETADLVATECGCKKGIEFSDGLYESGPDGYVRVVRDLPDEVAKVLVVGHNPALEETLALLTGRSEPLPTAALAQVDFQLPHWRDLQAGVLGEIMHLWRPRELP